MISLHTQPEQRVNKWHYKNVIKHIAFRMGQIRFRAKVAFVLGSRLILGAGLLGLPRVLSHKIAATPKMPQLFNKWWPVTAGKPRSFIEEKLYQRSLKKVASSEGKYQLPALVTAVFFNPSFEIFVEADLIHCFITNSFLIPYILNIPVALSAEQFQSAIGMLKRLLGELERVWEKDLDPSVRLGLAEAVTKHLRYVHLLFTDENLRPFAVTAGRYLEYFLESQGHQLDFTRPLSGPGAKIRVGVLVRNLQPRTETFIARAFCGGLDRTRFCPVLVSLEDCSSPTNLSCGDCCEEVAIISQGDLAAQVRGIRALDLDILIMCNAMAAQLTPYLMLIAHRLATIQVLPAAVWPQTSGLSRMDYALTAAITEPLDIFRQYGEQVLVQEGMFNCFDLADADLRSYQHHEANLMVRLPERPYSYACGGSLFKLTPHFRSVWLKILAQVPDSELIIYPFNQNWGVQESIYAVELLRGELAEAGLSPHRLVILPHLTPRQIVTLLNHVTAYLDTFPYSGAASFMEPMIAHCPVVGLRGQTQRGLQGSAMITALGIEELIADTPEQYVELAVRLAFDTDLRTRMVEKMKKAAPTVAFLDVSDFGQRLGNALEKMIVEQASWNSDELYVPSDVQ
jgi:predicted O-linked N-acetylglucosamine transferase (SPINDLY family)